MGELGVFVMNHWLLFMALVVILVMLIVSASRYRLLGFRELKPAEAVRMLNDQQVLLLDVRAQEEFAGGHIIHAVNIALDQLDARRAELEPYRDRPVIIYCQSGARAAKAAALLRKQGFERVNKLDGGVLAWQSAGLPLES